MSASVENLGGLERRLTFQLPAEEVEKAYQTRLSQVTRTVKLSGFRAGRVPTHIVEKRFGANILKEITNELMHANFKHWVSTHQVRVVGLSSLSIQTLTRGAPLECTALFEVYPEVELHSLQNCSVERKQVQISDEDIDTVLQTLRKQHAEWKEVEREARNGDRVIIDFSGTIDSKPFSNNSAHNYELELGSKRMLSGFEEGLLGVKKGETRIVNLSFPTEYPNNEVAGKEAEFTVIVHRILEGEAPPLDDTFVKKLGVDSGKEEDLREKIKTSMMQECERAFHQQLRMAVCDKLIEMNSIEVPKVLVENEIDRLQHMMRQQMIAQGYPEKQAKNIPFSRETFKEQAHKRVVLGVLFSEVIKKYHITASETRVRERVEEMAKAYEKPEEVISWYYNNKRNLAEIESAVLEDLAIEKLLEELQVNDKTVSYKDVAEAKQ